jgi:hypothetical protein
LVYSNKKEVTMARVFSVSGTVSFKVDGKLEPEIDDSFSQNIFGEDKLSMAALEQRVLEILCEELEGTFTDEADNSQHTTEVAEIQIEKIEVLAYDVYTMAE